MMMKKIGNYVLFAPQVLTLMVLSLPFMLSCGDDSERASNPYQGSTAVYFAHQNPVRTLKLGNDIYDNSLDNAHKCRIQAAVGGAYNGRDAVVDFVVDPSLCENLWFVDERGNPSHAVTPMPTSYYQLLGNTIPFNGDTSGYVEVQFTDAFFNDPKSVDKTYVIPLRMTGVNGIDRILTGTPREGIIPVRTNPEDWDALPMDYVLYCVKYINPWHGTYYRRGVDKVTENGVTKEYVRKDFTLAKFNLDPSRYGESPVSDRDEICSITTKNMTQAIFPVSFGIPSGLISCNLILTFNDNTCTISTNDEQVTATGNGELIAKGAERPEYREYQWGDNNGEPVLRDILRLSYNVNFVDKNIQVATTDTLAVHSRGSNILEFFQYKYK